MEYLNDIQFLQRVCSQTYQKIYTKINLLDKDEFMLESIEGIITSGNISIDGTSAIQRTCSLSLSTDLSKYIDFYWSLNSLIQIFIGISNITDKYIEYPIIYFPMGIYYLTNFSLSKGLTGYNISISGKDKMCKLTGELGGTFNSSVNFGTIDIIDLINNQTTHEQIPIIQIIQELIHFYGQEPYEKIIINDIDEYGLNLMTYRGQEPIYYFMQIKQDDNNNYIPYIINCKFGEINKESTKSIYSYNLIKQELLNGKLNSDNYSDKQWFKYDWDNNFYKIAKSPTQIDNYNSENKAVDNILDNEKFLIGKYEYGDTIGYELAALIYNGELVANPGETITSVLDKIKTLLGDFIYYYDINGNFIFKKKNEYLKEDTPMTISFSPKNTNYILFDKLINNISYSYNLSDIKNDFTVWGQRKTAAGVTMDIHARYAIDEKPTRYTSLEITEEQAAILIDKYPTRYYPDKSVLKEDVIKNLIQKSVQYDAEVQSSTDAFPEIKNVDWREVIYQMAKDFNKFNQVDEFTSWIARNNPQYPTGKTGYERYYTDILGFWRDLYNPNKTITVPSLRDLSSDSNIKYSIRLLDDEKDGGEECSFMMTSKGIEWRGGHKFEQGTQERINRQAQLRKEVGLDGNPTLFEIQMAGNSNGHSRIFAFSQPALYKNISWDIKSATFPNIKMYRKIFNSNSNEEEFLEVGYLNDIIANNYKILGYMYYLLSPKIFWSNLNYYLQSEDIETHEKKKWAHSALWRILAYNAEKAYTERFNFYNNKIWTFIKNNKAELLGIYYDVTTLYYNVQDIIGSANLQIISQQSISTKPIREEDGGPIYRPLKDDDLSETQSTQKAPEYLQLESYPQNKAGHSLTDIKSMHNDWMALLLWARENYILQETDNSFGDDGWKKDIREQPDQLNFWFDFLSTDKFSQKYSVRNIGPRELVKKDTSINCISTLAVPDIIFINPTSNISDTAEKQLQIYNSYYRKMRPNSTFMNISEENAKKNTIAATTKSAIDVIMNLIYNHAIVTNSRQISAIPQYYLKPDSILELIDSDEVGPVKKYLINKISFQLGANGLMSLNIVEFIDDILNNTIIRDSILDIK